MLLKLLFGQVVHCFSIFIFKCRNGLVPKKLHLEIALGNIFPREGNQLTHKNAHSNTKKKKKEIHLFTW